MRRRNNYIIVIYLSLGLLFLELSYFFWVNPVKWPEIRLWAKENPQENESLPILELSDYTYAEPVTNTLYVENADFAQSVHDIDSLIKNYRPNEWHSLHREVFFSKHGIKSGKGAIITIRTYYPGYKELIDDETFENITIHCPSLPEKIGDTVKLGHGECVGYRSSGASSWVHNGGHYGTALKGSVKLERLEADKIGLDIDMLFESYRLEEGGRRTRKDPVAVKGSYVANSRTVGELSP